MDVSEKKTVFLLVFISNAVDEVHKLPKAEEKQSYKERTYQWLHTQAVHPNTDSAGTGRWDTLLWTVFFWEIYTISY